MGVRMKFRFLLMAGVMASPLPAATPAPELAALPAVHESDSWTYIDTFERAPSVWRQTHDEVSVVHVLDDGLAFSSRQVGQTGTPAEHMVGRDWSRFRSIGGKEVVVNRPLAFPLVAGKSWDLQYTDPAPANHAHKSETYDLHYRVAGWEDVDVPAGHFHAIKIESTGHWTAETAPGATSVAVAHTDGQGSLAQVVTRRAPVAATVEGRLYKAFWYVPEVGRWVKSVEEFYDVNGNRSERYTGALESWHRAA